MATRAATELERLLDRVEKRQIPAEPGWAGQVALEIGKLFRVQPDEVAVLELASRGKMLKFVLPEKLQAVGSIPLSSTTALAARTARERRADIVNNFASSRHATVFEGVKITAEAAEAIQKMISAPILLDGKVIGVIQVSRKGANPASAGLDFTADDLGKILAFCKPLGKMLHHLAPE